jgi:hypothetical protein
MANSGDNLRTSLRSDSNALIYVAGHRGLVGSAIVRHLLKEGYTNLLGKRPVATVFQT